MVCELGAAMHAWCLQLICCIIPVILSIWLCLLYITYTPILAGVNFCTWYFHFDSPVAIMFFAYHHPLNHSRISSIFNVCKLQEKTIYIHNFWTTPLHHQLSLLKKPDESAMGTHQGWLPLACAFTTMLSWMKNIPILDWNLESMVGGRQVLHLYNRSVSTRKHEQVKCTTLIFNYLMNIFVMVALAWTTAQCKVQTR